MEVAPFDEKSLNDLYYEKISLQKKLSPILNAIESRRTTKGVVLAPNLPHLENLLQDPGSKDPNVLWTLNCHKPNSTLTQPQPN